MCSNKLMVHKLKCEPPGGLVKQIAGLHPRVNLKWSPKFAFLTCFQVILLLLVWGPHFENHCKRLTGFCSEISFLNEFKILV